MNGAEYLTLTYSRPAVIAHVVADEFEVSENMANWTPAETVVVRNGVEEGVRTVTIRDVVPIGTGTHRFLRLRSYLIGESANR